MAILAAHPGLSVQVVVDDQVLSEYEDDGAAQDDKSVTKYIEACTGSEFKLRYIFDNTFPVGKDLRVRCFIDGSLVRAPVVLRTRRHFIRKEFSIGSMKQKDGKDWRSRSFCFKELVVGESHDAEAADDSSLIGTIKLAFAFGKALSSHKGTKERSFRTHSEISEQELKGEAKSLQVGLGSVKAASAGKGWDFKADSGGPFATFIFKYRTRSNLQSLLIIPRELSPSPSAQVKEAKNSPSPPPLTLGTGTNERDVRENENSINDISLPADRNRTPKPSSSSAPPLLTKKDLLILIAHYRGTASGLEDLPEKDLSILLESYKNEKTEDMHVKREEKGGQDGGVRIKRERDDGAGGRGNAKKAKREVIVIDD